MKRAGLSVRNIKVRGAREKNLKDVTTEAQRQLYVNFSLSVRSFLPKHPQPDAGVIESLTMAVIVDQKRLGARLLGIIDRLGDGGNAGIVIEHSLNVTRSADWIIDVRPGPVRSTEPYFPGCRSLKTATSGIDSRGSPSLAAFKAF